MSLEHVAKHLASKGRKFSHGAEDTELVHMTKGEVAGLQQLAMAHGGSLTRNPDTGLPEAGFLSNLLPTLLGAASMLIPGMQPLGAAAIGAATGAMTNQKNPLMGALMGGLGGYGGAGLAGGIADIGKSAAATAAEGAAGTAGTTATQQAVNAAISDQAQQSVLQAMPNYAPTAQQAINQSLAEQAQQSLAKAPLTAPTSAGTTFTPPAPAAPTAWENMKTGASKLVSADGDAWDQFIGKAADTKAGTEKEGLGGYMGALKTTGMAAAPLLYGAMTPEEAAKEEELKARKYKYDAGYTGGVYADGAPYSSEQTWFNPTFTPMAAGGAIGFADGGEPKMTGASKEAFDYLHGRSAVSPATQAARQLPAPAPAPTAPTPTQASAPKPSGLDLMRNPSSLVQAVSRKLIHGEPTDPQESSGWVGANAAQSGNPKYTYDPSSGTYTRVYADGGVTQPYPLSGVQSAQPGAGVQGLATFMNRGGSTYSDVNQSTGEEGFAAGGGMESGGFVVPADVVSALGNGSSSAGLEMLASRFNAKPIDGPGDGMSDDIPTHIDGEQRAAVARDEAYISPKDVQRAGGAKKLYAMMDRIRQQAHGKTTQQRKLNPHKAVG